LKLTIVTQDEDGDQRMIEIDNVVEVGAMVNDGLSVGFGAIGITTLIIPKDNPAIAFKFNWAEALGRLLTR